MKELNLIFPGGKRIDVEVDGFVINTDQSLEGGGEGAYPEPFDYFLASLLACAGIYALNFCERRGISTKGLEMKLRCFWDKEKKLFSQMEFLVKLPYGFPERYKDALVRAMELCAVKRHMDRASEINMEFKFE